LHLEGSLLRLMQILRRLIFKMELRKPTIVDKVWGREDHIANFKDKGYCGKLLVLKEGHRCSIHRHGKDETFYVLKGRVFMELEGDNGEMEYRILVPGNVLDIFDKKWHRFSGLEDSVIVEFSTPDEESERKVDSGKIPDFENWKKEIEGKYGR